MDFHLNSDQKVEKAIEEENKGINTTSRQRSEMEPEEKGLKQWIMGWKQNKADEEDETGISPSRTRLSNKKKKAGKFPVKLVFKILVVAAVCCNLIFIWNFMKSPISTFYHTVFVMGICSCINFMAVWILFYKSSFKRFYLSIFAIIGSLGYYLYVNYTNHSFLGNNIITSVLVMISALMVINPKVNYYLKSFVLLLIPIIGIYLSNNQFALVWALMMSAGLVLLFRVSKSKAKTKPIKKEGRTKRSQKQPA